jgi:hypothetical protein
MRVSAEPGPCPSRFGLEFDPARLPAGAEGQEVVVGAFNRFKPDWAQLASRICFHPHRYVRTRLYADDDVEVLLLCWLPGQQTPVHDHGTSWGVSMPLCGSLVESSYVHRGAGRRMERAAENALLPGAIALETGATIHRIANASTQPAVSLHVYAPPLSTFGSYDLETGAAQIVTPPVEA